MTVQTLDRQKPAQADLEFKTLEALPELPKPANFEAITSTPDSGTRRRTGKTTSAAVPVADPKPAERKPAERKSERKTAKAGAKAKARSEGKSKAKAAAKKTKIGR